MSTNIVDLILCLLYLCINLGDKLSQKGHRVSRGLLKAVSSVCNELSLLI